MLTIRDIQNCEGYYYNVETGDILRNVGPGPTGCLGEGSWVKVSPDHGLDVPQYELLTTDISASFETVQEEAEKNMAILPDVLFIGRRPCNRMVLSSRKKRE